MRMFFLGTAAAEGYPAIFCDCANCQEARRLGGRNLRFRSALLVNDDLLIDFGPDLLASAQKHGKNLSMVTTGLVTHAHPDHFTVENFMLRREAFTARQTIPTLRLFGPHEIAETLAKAPFELPVYRVEAHTVHAFDCWKNGTYTFQAFHANHAVDVFEALFYSVDDGRRSILYACDTGAFPEDTWHALEGKSYNVIILEETMGFGRYAQHMDFDTFIDHAQRFRTMGLLRPEGRIIAHHFSHTENPCHEKIEAVLAPHGIEVAYDGLEICLD